MDFGSPRGEGMNERTNERMDRNSSCVLQDFVPFGAAAQKGKEKMMGNQKTFEVSYDIICILQFEDDWSIVILLIWNTVN